MDLRQLEAFVAVATQLSFKAAANRLNLSQPAISSRITAFEAELGKTLFKRDTKPVTLTDDAVRMLPHAERILEIFNDMLPASATKAPTELRIGSNGTLVHSWLPEILMSWSDYFPGIELAVEEDVSAHTLQRMHDGSIDIGLLSSPVDIPGFKRILVCSLLPVFLAKPGVMPDHQLSLRDLGDKKLVIYERPAPSAELLREALSKDKIKPRNIVTSSSTGFIKHCLMTTRCVGTLIRNCVAGELAKGDLVELDLGFRMKPFDIYCCYPTAKHNLVGKSFAQHLQEFFANIDVHSPSREQPGI